MAKRLVTIWSPTSSACPSVPCSESLANCSNCDGFVLVPMNPALLVPGVLYLDGQIVSGPVTEGNKKYWMVEIEETLLADPGAAFSQCDYRVCCNDCVVRFVKTLFGSLAARVSAIDGQ